MMNPEAQIILDEILKKDPDVLTLEERKFLRARRTYLKKSQVEEYKEVLEAVEETTEVVEEKVSFNQLLRRAKELGFVGGKAKRAKLEEFIAEQERKNPFI